MIRHSVIFALKYEKGSTEEMAFMKACKALEHIPGVRKFESLKQISKKNKFDYGLSMEFLSREHYDAYSNHPAHVSFIEQYWIAGVEDFLEIDYELMNI